MSQSQGQFLALPAQYTDIGTARFVILPAPFDGTATFRKGCSAGPAAIVAASPHLEEYDEQLGDEFFQAGIHTAAPVVEPDDTAETVQHKVYAAALALMRRGKTVMALGGEHSISTGLVRAAVEVWPDVSVLHFDAHADLRDCYEGSPLNHACVMRRIHDLGVPFVSVGVRAYSKGERDFMKEQGLELITVERVENDFEGALADIRARLSGHLYVTFDIDALDPALCPGTGTPEPDGLSYRQAAALLSAIVRERQLVGADVVEVLPMADSTVTEFTAAKLVYKLIALAQLGPTSAP